MSEVSEIQIDQSAFDSFKNGLIAARQEVKPPEQLALSEWANKYAVLSKETSAQTGRFTSFKYQDGIMDAVTDPAVVEVTVMKSARVGYTKILDHVIGYHIHHDPSPMLVVQPRVEDAEDYSKTEITPMLRDTPVLAAITGDLKAKTSNQTILKKTFSNGANLSLVGANSPGGFRRITVRLALFDEIDAYPVGGAGVEGDQIALGTKRTETFWNRKIIKGSTPTVEGISRIKNEYLKSDQCKCFVPCPHCGEYQILEWGDENTPYGIKWDKDENGHGLPETTFYACRHNGCVIKHYSLPSMVEHCEWRPTSDRPFNGHRGFHIWAAYSLFPNASWPNLVKEWLEVKNNPLERQTFINLVLGETYEDKGEKSLNEKSLAERCEVYAAEVPDNVAVITAGVDTQDGRFEIEIVGWGKNEESWSIAYDVIEGDLETNEPWDRLDAYLKQIWRRADGRGFNIMATCMDSGGHHTQKVYEFCKDRLGRRIFATKGESARGGARSPVWPTKRPTSRNKSTFKPIILGVNAAKDVVRNRLHLTPPKLDEDSPGYMHFPVDRDLNYFAQLLSESLIVKSANGQKFRVWELRPGRANEALDCRVYAYAALCGLFQFGLKLNNLAQKIKDNQFDLVPASNNESNKVDYRYPGVVIEEQPVEKVSRHKKLA
ncbi:phage terminase large subunit family protein (plasmid) [Orbus sturtevantii]|uniref:phage terminase large subunit family protein n=1 Tax=Orbus sturtevantii TaxID=3074109 RepID=UPI00370DC847